MAPSILPSVELTLSNPVLLRVGSTVNVMGFTSIIRLPYIVKGFC